MRDTHVPLSFRSFGWIGVAALLAFGPSAPAAIAQSYTFAHFAGTRGGAGAVDGTTSARLRNPYGVTLDAAGNLYVTDAAGTIRKITPGGVVTTFAGNAGSNFSSDGARAAGTFASPQHLTIDGAGNLYVADGWGNRVRKVTPAGVVTTLAGNGTQGAADGTGEAARFHSPTGIAYDAASGILYVTDSWNHTIRRITAGGVVTTLAGLAGTSGSADGTGSAARFLNPSAVAVDAAGTLYVADWGNHTIRRITPAGAVTTLAGLAGSAGSADGTGSSARFYNPIGIATDSAGNAYVADQGFNKIRKVTPAGAVSTIAGGTSGYLDGIGVSARFSNPKGIVVDPSGNLYVTDTSNDVLRRVTAAGVVTTVGGTAAIRGSDDATGMNARFRGPRGITIAPDGNMFVTDSENHTIRKITPAGVVTTLAGTPGAYGSANGTGSAARFSFPRGIASDASGILYVTDHNAHTIRKITAAGVVTTLAGTPASSGSTDGTGAVARFYYPEGVATDAAGNVYVADTANHTIRRITPAGVVTTFAGMAGNAGAVDATGTAARFNRPQGLAIDSGGSLYVADSNNHAVRKVTPAGVVTTFAGSLGQGGYIDDTGSAARFFRPESVAIDGSGNVYIAETDLAILRKITPAGVVTTMAGAHYQPGTEDGTGTFARLGRHSGLAVDGFGTIYVTDSDWHSIRRGRPAFATVATIDSATGPVFVPRQLGVSAGPGLGWIWSIVRRPSLSSADLSSPTAASPTFTPDVPDTYVFRLAASDGPSSSITLVTLTASCWTITIGPSSVPNGLSGTAYSKTLVAAGGNGIYTFQKMSGTLPPGLTLSAGGVLSGTLTTPGDYSFTVRATDSWACFGERTYALRIEALEAPTGLVATWGVTGVSLTWNGVSGAAGYRIYRHHAGGYVVVGTTATTAFLDASAGADTAYLYRVRAYDAADFESPDSNRDLAATFTFTDPTLVAGSTQIKAVHVAQLRSAVNAVHLLAGLGATSFTDASLAGVAVKGVHLTQLRMSLDAARAALSLPAAAYTDPMPEGVAVKAAHINQLRNGVK